MGTTISGALYINYPPGFTYQNTVIISTMAQFAGEDYYVSCDSDRIGVTAEPTSIRMNANGSYINQKYKLTIMRIN